MGILARASAREIEERLSDLRDIALPDYRPVRGPETGMVMVQARAGGTGSRFNAGEMTVTRCALALSDGAVGCAYVAGRDPRHAELAALLDGLLQRASSTSDRIRAGVIEPLAAAQQETRDRRAREAAATKVEFFTMVRGED